MRVTIRQIESFLAVAELGNFSRAGARLNIAQPALSQAIKELEAELSVRLFDRTTRRVELTDAGREFRHAAEKILDDLGHAVKNAKDVAAKQRGRIRIAAPPLLAALYLPGAIAAFKKQYPSIVVVLDDVGTEQIIEKVRNGSVDCGVGTFSPAERDFDRTVLMRDSLVLVSRRGADIASGAATGWRDLASQPIVTLTRDSNIRLLVEVGFETAGIAFLPAYEFAHIGTALGFVEAGLGVAVLPAYALADVGSRDLVGRTLREPTITREVVLIHATGRSASPALQAFVGVLSAYARRIARRAADSGSGSAV